MMGRTDIPAGERIDDIGFGGLKLIQKPDEFCYGIDSVLLADFAAVNHGSADGPAADLGTGSGVVSLILSHKMKNKDIIAVEFQKKSADRARRTIALNGLEDRISVIDGDVKDVSLWGSGYKGLFSMVVSNPPYFPKGSALVNPNDAKGAARHETTAGLREFMACAAYLLRPKGDFFLVHKPSRLVDICCLGREAGLEPKQLCFVSPKAGMTPNILLAHLTAGGGKELKVLPPMAVYDGQGNYTEEILRAYERYFI